MKGKLLALFVFIILGFTFVTACSNSEEVSTANAQLSQLEDENLKLTKSVKDKEDEIKKLNQKIGAMEDQLKEIATTFNAFNDIVPEFEKAYIAEDKEALQQFMSPDILLEEKENGVIAKLGKSEVGLINYKHKLTDFTFTGYNYDYESNIVTVNFKVSYNDLNYNNDSSLEYLYLNFEQTGKEWVVVNFGGEK